MKHLKKVVVPEHEETRVIFTTCDLCREKLDGGGPGDIDEVTIEHRVGYDCYGEGGSVEATRVDLCGKCFKEKLLPWLESNGVKPDKEEVDW